MHIPTNYPLGDDYFTFIDKINAAVAVTTKARSTAAATLEAEVAAALQAEADQRGVTLGWLLRSTDGDESDDADSGSETYRAWRAPLESLAGSAALDLDVTLAFLAVVCRERK